MKYILKLSSIAISMSLISCYSPGSADPIGDTFTHTGNAIGKVVNKVVPPASQYTPQQYAPRQQYAPYPNPTGYPTR